MQRFRSSAYPKTTFSMAGVPFTVTFLPYWAVYFSSKRRRVACFSSGVISRKFFWKYSSQEP